jgi:hypothetical protein
MASLELRRLELKMAALQYKKKQNSGEIRSVLNKSTQLERSDRLKQLSMDRSREKVEWATTIIENELMQPLEVNKQTEYIH